MAYGGRKLLHLFWGRSRPLSWLRLQTVVSFARLNPDWHIKVWYRDAEPKKPYWRTGEQSKPYNGRDYFDALPANVERCKPDFDLALPDVPFSDYLRWRVLGEEGGFWSDFDIVYIRPMDLIGNPTGPFLIQYPCGVWPIGFLGAPDELGQWFFAQLEKLALQRIGTADYQGLGCILLERWVKMQRKTAAQPQQWVYPEYRLKQAERAFFAPVDYKPAKEFIGMHWFAGAAFASEFESSIDPDNLTADQKRAGVIKALGL